MARDTQKNSAYDSGLRGKEKPRVKRASSDDELLLPNGACEVSIRPAVNGFIVNCSYPPKRGKDAMSIGWRPPDPYVCTTAEELAEYLTKELGVKKGS